MCVLDVGVLGRAAVPSGASTGTREAVELRDGDKTRYLGKGVRKAVGHVNNELKARGARASTPPTRRAIDQTDDRARRHRQQGPPRRQCAAGRVAGRRAGRRQPTRRRRCSGIWRTLGTDRARKPVMPVPMMNIINGGAHADNTLDMQEFMILPVGAPSFSEALRYGAEIFHTLKKILHDTGLATVGGRRGRFCAEPASPTRKRWTIITEAIDKAGYKLGKDIYLGLDVASTEFFKDGKYHLEGEGRSFDSAGFADYLAGLSSRYPDRHHRGRHGRGRLGRLEGASPTSSASKVQLVGDDLFVTNTKILKEGIDKKIANSILIKVNQIGTLTETLAAIEMAEKAKYASIVSHRSGETEDSHHRRHRGGDRRDADQDRLAVALRPHRQVQPAAAHRRRAGQGCGLRGSRGLPLRAVAL